MEPLAPRTDRARSPLRLRREQWIGPGITIAALAAVVAAGWLLLRDPPLGHAVIEPAASSRDASAAPERRLAIPAATNRGAEVRATAGSPGSAEPAPAEDAPAPGTPEVEWPILRGLAIDKLTGEPAVGVTVSSGDYWDGGVEVLTNERGEFDVEEHSQILILHGGGYAYEECAPWDDREGLRWSAGRVVVPLAKSARAHGRITNQSGDPVVTGYVVGVAREHAMYWSTRQTEWAALPGVGATYRHSCAYNTAAWIGADGTYVLEDLPTGEEFHIVVESVDELPDPFGPYSLEPGVDAEIDLQTRKSSRIKGKLVCAPMGHFENVTLRFRPEHFYARADGLLQRDGGVVGFASPLEDGSFESPALYPYERISVSVHGNYYPWPGSQPFDIQKGASVELPPESVVEVEIELWP